MLYQYVFYLIKFVYHHNCDLFQYFLSTIYYLVCIVDGDHHLTGNNVPRAFLWPTLLTNWFTI